jgi:hypothetical protein
MAGGTPRTLLLLLLLLLCLLLRLGGGRKAAGAGQRSRRVQTAGAGGSARSKRSPQAFHDWEDDDDDDDEEEEQDEDDEQVQGFDVGYSDEEEEEEEEIGDDDDEEDDDEDDDDEDDFPDRLPSTRERAPSYPSWKRASSRRRDDYRRIPAIDTALVKAKLGAVASQLTSTVSSTKRSVTRELRMYTSGSWEKRLLAATWPDNDIPDPKLVKEIMREVSQFRRDLDVTRQSSEHRIFLHKIWLKMTELDWRTKVKALYLLHAIVTRLPPEDAVVMQRFILKMGREKCKKSKSNYFDLEVISETDPAGQHWHGFVGRYGEYVLKRAATFSGAFDELKALKREHGFENVVAVLVKARKLIDLSLTCGPEADEEVRLSSHGMYN